MKKILIILYLLILMSFTGCANRAQNAAGVGGLSGALIGSFLGPEDDSHRIVNSLIGAGVGSLFGYIVGNETDKYYNREYPVNNDRYYNKYDDNRYHKGQAPIIPYSKRGSCQTVYVDTIVNGRIEKVRARMCRKMDGTWQLVW